MLEYILFVIGFLLLLKGADLLVDGASTLAKKLQISTLIIGLTVVSFGTSAPELIINIFASLEGNSDIAIGNVFGSNIANILLILGISALICPLPVKRNTILSEIPFSLSAAIIVGFLANATLFFSNEPMTITQLDGLLLLFFFVLFMVYIYKVSREHDENFSEIKIKDLSTFKSVSYVVIGSAALFVGGKWVVDGAILIGHEMGLSDRFIGLTIVAIGTSLPELAASAMAAHKGVTDIAVGNVVGSNIFNMLWILGISSVIKPLPFNDNNNIDILIIIFASSLLILTMAMGKKYIVDRWEGGVFLLIYAGYIFYLFQTL